MTSLSLPRSVEMWSFPNRMTNIRDQILLQKVAHRIKELRSAKKITQHDFYSDTNIHIARIEQGKQNISICTLNAICEYFGLGLVEFFAGIEL